MKLPSLLVLLLTALVFNEYTLECGAQSAPSTPVIMSIESSTPQSMEVEWAKPPASDGVIREYIVTYVPSAGGANRTFRLFTFPPYRSTLTEGVTANTSYNVSVQAVNEFLNTSEPSDVRQVTTQPFSTDPGALLVATADQIEYYHISEVNHEDISMLTNSPIVLARFDSSANPTAFDYHYHRREIYIAFNDSSIVKYIVNVTEGPSQLNLTMLQNQTIYSGMSSAGTITDITVDWVNNVLYWIVTTGSASRLYSGSLTGEGQPRVVGADIEGTVSSLSVDPIHGYMYWVIVDAYLVRVPLSVVQTASSTTNLSLSQTFLFNGTSVSAFTLDLADSRYFILNDASYSLKSLIGNDLGGDTFPASPSTVLKMTSYNTSIYYILQTSSWFILERPALTVASFMMRQLFDIKMFRNLFQPLPFPPSVPTNIDVIATNTTANISWSRPVYSSAIFGNDSFSEWTYIVQVWNTLTNITMETNSTFLFLSSLQVGSLYDFTIRVVGSGGFLQTEIPLYFTTLPEGQQPELLIAGDQGLIRTNYLGQNNRYISRGDTDGSTDGIYNSHLNITYVAKSGPGELSVQEGEDGQVIVALDSRSNQRDNPIALQLDWITRRLYWVESSQRIVSVSTVGFSDSGHEQSIETFYTESTGSITDMAIDSSSGVLFWISDSYIKGRTLNGLETIACFNASSTPAALTIDPVNKRLYYLTFTSSILTVGQIQYSTFSCDANSHVTRSLSQLSFSDSSRFSVAYGANTLFITERSQTVVYTLPAYIQSDNMERTPVIRVIQPNPSTDSSNVFEAISVVLPAIQPLPSGLDVGTTGNLLALTPPPPGLPVLNNVTSNATFIDITWTPSDFSFSPVVYTLKLNLTRLDGTREERNSTVFSGNSYQISGQSFSTTVDVIIISYSYWLMATRPINNTFISPPALPGQVQNVQVFPYFPLKDTPSALSALVIWDGLSAIEAGGVVDQYYINIINANTGEPLTVENIPMSGGAPLYAGPPFSTSGDSTEFSLTIQGVNNRQFFIITGNQSYNIEVFAGNAAGNGTPSDTLTFYTNVTSSPMEIISLSSNGGSVVTERGNLSLAGVTPPFAFDNLRRTLYYYNSTDHSVYTRALDNIAESVKLVELQSSFQPLAFGYDWIAQTLYMAGNSTAKTSIQRVFRLYPKGLSQIYSSSEETIFSADVNMGIVINPFTGFLYWTEYSGDISVSRLNQLNLTDNSVSSLISSSSSRGKREAVEVSSLEPTGAIVWDIVTDKLWFCDSASGDIISCNVNSSGQLDDCSVEVNRSIIATGSGSGIDSTSETGLPCDSLTLDETNIYWTISNSLLMYYVTRNDRTMLLTIPLLNKDSIIVSTGPGLQPFPQGDIHGNFGRSSSSCLSPNLSPTENQPQTTVHTITNTSAAITWTVVTSLPADCAGRVVSTLPLSYLVDLESQMDPVPGYPMGPIFTQEFNLTDLQPFTSYEVKVLASNEYTVGRMPSLFGPGKNFPTREGVPDVVDGLTTTPFGPRHMFITWNSLNETQLRGHLNNQAFRVFVDNQQVSNQTVTRFNISNLTPNTTSSFGVIVSNGVLDSSLTSVSGRTWLLPPTPVAVSLQNTSIVAMVTLEEDHSVLSSLTVYLRQEENQIRINSSNYYNLSYVSLPITLEYNFTELQPNTNYTIVAEGEYYSVNSLPRAQPERQPSDIITTAPGVPERPTLNAIANNVLSWNAPNDNGARISQYLVRARNRQSFPNETIDLSGDETSVDLSTRLREDVSYMIYLIAVNMVGPSEESEPVDYINSQTPFYTTLPFIVGVSGGGVLVLVLLFLFIFTCCFCCCFAGRKDSHTFRPDYELRGLRALNSRSQSASNPHYLWSRDNFLCTDEDLELLNKFPRNKLRLENFIDRGEFGEVYQGTAVDILGQGTGPTPVAVKTMRKGSTDEEQRKFLSEAALMSNFNHLNIVKVLGVCLDNDPIYIIMELMPGGDLLKFLREAQRDHGPPLLTLTELVQLALDVAQGCRYLEQQHFIHRDIAARNCLVSSKGADRVIKIGDFGLAKDLYSSDYYQVEGQRKLPVRWMAPEALTQGKFSIESDIWSYGILLWEIMTFGNQPYPGRTNQEVLQFVTADGRLDKPENCPGRLYKLMQCCWKKYASERPNFAQIVDVISNFWDHLNNRRDSYCSEDDDEELEEVLQRKPSRPSRTSSVRSGFVNLARQGSMRIRNSFRRRGSLHRKEEHDSHAQNHAGLNSEEDLIGDDRFRERGPF